MSLANQETAQLITRLEQAIDDQKFQWWYGAFSSGRVCLIAYFTNENCLVKLGMMVYIASYWSL